LRSLCAWGNASRIGFQETSAAMFDASTFLVFTGASVMLALTPGPDMLVIASRSAVQGRPAGWASLLGVQLGTYTHAIATALGLSALLATVPIAYDVIRVLGALYLLWLAWQAVRPGGSVLRLRGDMRPQPVPSIVLQGFLTNVLNPKVALFVLAFFPPFVDPETGSILLQMLMLASIINAAGLVVNGSVILMAGGLGRFLERNRHALALQKWFLGAVFAGLGLKLLLDARR
jgi:threonine/homoserine/homoserine lactone efflux protein